MGRTVSGYVPVNANVVAPQAFDVDVTGTGAGLVPASLNATVSVVERGDEAFHQTVFTLVDMPQAVVNGTEYQGTKIYQFPAGRLHVLGVTAVLAQKTTSIIADTINSATGAVALGTVTASNVALTGTMVNFLPSTAFTSSTVINTAGTAVGAVLAAAAVFDGTSSAIALYLNSAYATTGDVDADGTQTWTGTITVSWCNLGDI